MTPRIPASGALAAACAVLVAAGCAALRSPPLETDEYTIRFEGNRAFDDGDLMAEIRLDLERMDERSSRKAVIDDAAFTLERFYQSEGFPFARVSYEIDEGTADVVRAVFGIEEGPRTVVADFRVSGNVAFDQDTLESFLDGPRAGLLGRGDMYYVERRVESAADAIAAYYYSNGFLDSSVAEPVVRFSEDRREARVRVEVREGPRYYLRGVRIEGGTPEIERGLRTEGFVGKPYAPHVGRSLRGRIAEIYARKGYPEADVELAERRVSDGGEGPGGRSRKDVEVFFRVAAGPLVVIRDIRITGNEKTKEDRIRAALEIEPGERYDEDKVRKSFRNLYRTGLFTTVRLELSEEASEERTLHVEVVEAPSTEVYVEPGYGSYEQFRLGLGVRERNLFGTGRSLSFEGTAAILAQRAVIGLNDPRLFDSNVAADVSLFANRREEPSFLRQDLGGALTFSRQLTDSLHASAGYQLRRSQVSDADVTDPDARMALNDVDISSLLFSPRYDTRGPNSFAPRRGNLSKLSMEFGADFIGSELDFLRTSFTQSNFFELSSDSVLGLSWRGGLIVPLYGTDTIPLQERYFNGGENTVRSFTEDELGPEDAQGNAIGGEAFNVFSVELRQRIVGNFEGALFWDTGNLLGDYNDYLGFEDFRHAIGGGLRYLLPVGPIRLDAAWNPDARPDEDDYAVHFSVGLAF